MNRAGALAVLVAFAAALLLRLPHLDARPLHNDEAVNATKLAELWQHGKYAYNPDEYHGPTLHYLSLPLIWCSGARASQDLTDVVLRLTPVAFGAGLIVLLLLLADGLGDSATGVAALLLAISPAMVFYSRYFIHEMPLTFFSLLTIGAGWRYVQSHAARWAVLAGLGLGLMWATKETFVLNCAAAVPAAGLAWLWRRRERQTSDANPAMANPAQRLVTAQELLHAGYALGAALIVWMLFFSSFGTHWKGLSDSVVTYYPWLKRAGGHSPHINPWYFYLERLTWFHPAKGPYWTEGLILLLAGIGTVVSLTGKRPALQRFLALYTMLLTLLYSAIAYKTPWCLLGFFLGMILLAAVGAVALVRCTANQRGRAVIMVLLGVSIAQLTWQSWRASFVYPGDRRNPYVYAQTVPDFANLMARMDGLARVSPRGDSTVVKVVVPENDYWPLPWTLRRFQHVGWYDRLPDDPFAPIIIVDARLNAWLDEKSNKRWLMAGRFELRPRVFLELYVNLDLWKKYVASLPPPSED